MNCQVRVTAGDHKDPKVEAFEFDEEDKAIAFMAVLTGRPEVLLLEFIADGAVQFEVCLNSVM